MSLGSTNNVQFDVEAFRLGSAQDAKIMYTSLWKPLVDYVWRLIGYEAVDRETAEDIVSECMVVLWKRRNEFESLDSIKAFLIVACRNKAINHLKANKTRVKNTEAYQRHFNENMNEGVAVFQSTPWAMALLFSKIEEAIDNLPPQIQRVMKLNLRGFSIGDIASAMNVTHQAASKSKMRGIELLQERMASSDPYLLSLIVLLTDTSIFSHIH